MEYVMCRFRNPPFIISALILWSGAGLAAQPADAVATITAHNQVRSADGVPPLVWSDELATIATDYAATLEQQGCPRELPHSPASDQGELGENLYWAGPVMWSDGRTEPQQLTPAQVVNSWAAEKANYNYETNSCAPGRMCGHYTQLVWAATTEVGCGYAVCTNNAQVWVCNYRPAGNVTGQSPY
ncbi:CAP domain-containing protein [Methylocaldum sp. RMAD-M]|jgi:pathogenesis-related protein 1|uniref:CAP domain-containing protein n=2 Tax=Methylocaldum TaxID=73778 RepID=UPI00111C0A1E|nr:CAP domain-containing protein [Methylocaldum sp. RMAD-M]MDV3242266.1 CAP domain-containing protein [Methylocaldum sp.]MVF20463.1 SCP-like extracellular [Methylocaldum sp. BRCS4]